MHELSLARSLLGRVTREAEARGAVAVRRVRVRVGDLAGVEPALFLTAFHQARRGTVCGDAELEIAHEPARWICGECERPIDGGGALRCPSCGGPANLVAGAELLLEQIEMEVA